MQRVPGPSRRLTILHVAVALLIQFAPSIHVSGAHHHEQTACKHGTQQIHFEASTGVNDAPCLICAQLLTRQALVEAAGPDSETILAIAGNFPPPSLHLGKPALEPPDNRGPPHTF
jgi:hypothetical protein